MAEQIIELKLDDESIINLDLNGDISATGQNVGTGIGVFKEKVGDAIRLRSIKEASSNITVQLSQDGNEILIDAGTEVTGYTVSVQEFTDDIIIVNNTLKDKQFYICKNTHNGYEIVFDGDDFYSINLDSPQGDFDIDFYLEPVSITGGGWQSIFSFNNQNGTISTFLSIISLYIQSDDKLSFMISDDDGIQDYQLVGTATALIPEGIHHKIRALRVGDNYKIYINDILIIDHDSLVQPNVDRFNISRYNNQDTVGKLKNGSKIKKMIGTFQWNNLYQDFGKNQIVNSNGQIVSVIETPSGDIIQSNAANKGTSSKCNVKVIMPDASSFDGGKEFVIKDGASNASNEKISIIGTGGQLIENESQYDMVLDDGCVKLINYVDQYYEMW